MAGMMAISSGDLTTCLMAGERPPSEETGEIEVSRNPMRDAPLVVAAFLLAFCALRSVALVSLRNMRSNSSL